MANRGKLISKLGIDTLSNRLKTHRFRLLLEDIGPVGLYLRARPIRLSLCYVLYVRNVIVVNGAQ